MLTLDNTTYISVMPLALAHSKFGSSINPITTRGADYAHHITASPPGFENPAASLLVDTIYPFSRDFPSGASLEKVS